MRSSILGIFIFDDVKNLPKFGGRNFLLFGKKGNHILVAAVKKLKHNAAGIITTIQLEMKNSDGGKNTSYSLSDDDGIAGVDITGDGSGSFGFSTVGKNEKVVVGYGKPKETANQMRQAERQLQRAQRQAEMEKTNIDSVRKERIALRAKELHERSEALKASQAELKKTQLELMLVKRNCHSSYLVVMRITPFFPFLP